MKQHQYSVPVALTTLIFTKGILSSNNITAQSKGVIKKVVEKHWLGILNNHPEEKNFLSFFIPQFKILFCIFSFFLTLSQTFLIFMLSFTF